MSFWRKLIRRFVPSPGPAETPIDWEALFIEADLGLVLTQCFYNGLATQKLLKQPTEAEAWVRAEIEKLFKAVSPPPEVKEQPEVILLVGVNGSGKTTSAAKLSQRALRQGRKVCLGAADTFRAAAVDQLQVWGERLNIPVISAPPGTDPASVAFQSYEAARRDGANLLIVDTAGRLPNKHNLMLEIGKMKRTLQKKSPAAPHHVWLVVDGTIGNNVLTQAQEFHQAVGLTGLIVTKLDGSAKGGMIAAVQAELGVPTIYVGHGENLDDLQPFDSQRYVAEFFGE